MMRGGGGRRPMRRSRLIRKSGGERPERPRVGARPARTRAGKSARQGGWRWGGVQKNCWERRGVCILEETAVAGVSEAGLGRGAARAARAVNVAAPYAPKAPNSKARRVNARQWRRAPKSRGCVSRVGVATSCLFAAL